MERIVDDPATPMLLFILYQYVSIKLLIWFWSLEETTVDRVQWRRHEDLSIVTATCSRNGTVTCIDQFQRVEAFFHQARSINQTVVCIRLDLNTYSKTMLFQFTFRPMAGMALGRGATEMEHCQEMPTVFSPPVLERLQCSKLNASWVEDGDSLPRNQN